ncbi:PhnP protein [Strigomonas culicis]|uniref:PhnP protein n=1 Tax=Strigomonas culicis TaxID=28005 RepID=S9UJL2_9TRYP|nr:PhnP protein [Strigomonas culicis]EPY33684.1 PhnP protein [Strigomonas culicis]|eukprot:EPY28964.1 PhnP protein [Strigomonas culicis]
MGLDDLREFRRLDDVRPAGARGTPVVADERTMGAMRRVFGYLFPAEWEPAAPPRSWVATIAWRLLRPRERTSVAITSRDRSGAVAAFDFVALPVLHGPQYECNSFLFRMDAPGAGGAPRWLLYMSDVSELDVAAFAPQLREAQQQLLSPAEAAADAAPYQPLELLVLDMMSWAPYVSHLSVEAALALAAALGARQTHFTGLSHTLEYAAMTQELHRRGVGGCMAMGYDGCVIAEAADGGA